MKILALIFLSLLTLASCAKSVSPPVDPAGYYDGLKASCGENRCCATSVNMMRNKGATEMDKNCPSGTKENALTCEGSRKWCEKETILSGTTSP